MDLGLRDRRALVTGGSRGIGRGIADALHAEGARVVVCSRTGEGVDAASGLVPVACDLSSAEAVSRLVPTAVDLLGGVDILVLGGGGPPSGEIDDLPRAAWQAWFQTMWMSVVDLVNAVVPGMTERGFGRILLVGSVAAREPIKNLVLSNSMRAGLLGLLKSVSNQVAVRGVTVNAILPGTTDTGRRIRDIDIDAAALMRSVPAGRLGTTREIGALAAFLASSQAGYITGQAIACDGGLSRGA